MDWREEHWAAMGRRNAGDKVEVISLGEKCQGKGKEGSKSRDLELMGSF